MKHERILALSDVVDPVACGPGARERFGEIDLVIGCGDLPYDYLDRVATVFGAPLVAVHGNHDVPLDRVDDPHVPTWWHQIDLHGRVVEQNGLTLAGLGGSPVYNNGPFQYEELDLWLQIVRQTPRLLWNRLRRGRAVDILVTHAPPRGIHDLPDQAHLGFKAVRWFLRIFRPRYHLHGHIHIYDGRVATQTRFGDTTVLNAYGVRELQIDAQ
jgi:Icc-related predicted phosphoesterase